VASFTVAVLYLLLRYIHFTITILVECLFIRVVILQSFTVAGMRLQFDALNTQRAGSGCNFTIVYGCGNVFTV